ncbi:MAG: ABC transporter substrate-binding protein [Deltaproteobacteria bacterium]|nr:MAG: ABC transporter substrate-binding protein [Deltaproteobacteria bacterium]
MRRTLTLILAVAFVFGFLFGGTAFSADKILIGHLADLTGPTSAVGKPYAEGVKDAAKYINDHGGINGKKIELLTVDYAYDKNKAITQYKKFVQQGVIAIQGWGTGDTEALTKFVAKDKIPYMSASYSAHLTDPKKSPYNFFIAADYTTQLRAGLKFLKDNWKESRPPKIAFIYPNHPYGLAPIKGGKEYAKELGFEIVGDEIVDLRAIEATSQLLSIKEKGADFAWIGGTTPSTAVILKDARKLGLKTKFLINIWGNDENLLKLAEGAQNGRAYGLQAAAVYGDDVPGMKPILEVTGGKHKMTHYIRGWVSMMVMAEALKRADKAGELNGPGIKKALESLRDFDTGGLTAPITYTPNDHRPNMSAKIYKYENDKMIYVTTIELPRKKEWLGY